MGFFALMSLAGWCVLSPLSPPQDLSSRPPSSPAYAASTEKREHTILFVGDVMLSRAVGSRMETQRDWKQPFEVIADTLLNADLRFCNLSVQSLTVAEICIISIPSALIPGRLRG